MDCADTPAGGSNPLSGMDLSVMLIISLFQWCVSLGTNDLSSCVAYKYRTCHLIHHGCKAPLWTNVIKPQASSNFYSAHTIHMAPNNQQFSQTALETPADS